MTSSDTITMKWDGTIVLLSIFTAFIGSYSTVILYEQYRLCSRENRPKLLSPHMLLVLMAISLGGIAIWTMHFVAMSSVKMYQSNGDEIIVRYRQDYTLISLFVVILFCYIGLRIGSYDSAFKDDKHDAIQKFMHDARTLTIDEIRRIKNVKIFILSRLFQNISVLLCSGMITATGVCIMHYLGMEAMSFKGYIVWNKGIVAASVLIAIVAATAAVWILYRLLSFFPNIEMLRFLCSVVAAIAVNGMHYCGQAAATFHYVSDKKQVPHTQSFDQQNSTIVAIVVSAVFLFTVLIISISDLRMWYNNNIQLLRELGNSLLLLSLSL